MTTTPARRSPLRTRAFVPPALGRRALLVLAPAVGITALVGCSSDDAAPTPTDGAPANGAAVNVDTFAANLARSGTVVLDVRTPAEFATGHLPDAVNLDVSADDFRDRVAELDRDTPYAVYCHSGNRSATAVSEMVDLGFTTTYHLAGGVGAWTRAGHELVT